MSTGIFDELLFKVNLSVADNSINEVYNKLLAIAFDCGSTNVHSFNEIRDEYQIICDFGDYAISIKMTHDNYDINITTDKGYSLLWREYSTFESLKNLNSDPKVKRVVEYAWKKQQEINERIKKVSA